MSSFAVDSALPTLAVCGASSAETEPLERTVREGLGWTVFPVCWDDRELVSGGSAHGVEGYLVLGRVPSALGVTLSERRTGVPLLHVAAQPQPELRPTCWLPASPAPGVLQVLLTQLFERPATPARSWRRKSDMIIGRSPGTEQLLKSLDQIAPSMAPVLVTGESGTGKELVARALHYSGPRANAPLVAVNCAAIPAGLIESELFGHARGAFTGAVAAHRGLFEAAHGGTLFLDEIGEMPLVLQAKLLRVIETGEVTRVGSTEVCKVDVRLVSATNRDLAAEAEAGNFREDLYYRIRVFHLAIPPLRQRPDDIPPLVSHYLSELARRDKRPTPRITPAALQKLLGHRWPGNVRELVNVMERALVLAPAGHPIEPEHISLPERETPLIRSYRHARDEWEAEYYAQLLRTVGGNISLAAKMAKRTRAQLYESLRRLDLDVSAFRPPG